MRYSLLFMMNSVCVSPSKYSSYFISQCRTFWWYVEHVYSLYLLYHVIWLKLIFYFNFWFFVTFLKCDCLIIFFSLIYCWNSTNSDIHIIKIISLFMQFYKFISFHYVMYGCVVVFLHTPNRYDGVCD